MIIQQPQAFLSLWIVTLETNERVAIAEYLRQGKRVYEPYQLDVHDEQQLASLFGPSNTGEHKINDTITISEHEHKCTGEVIYVLPPGKASSSRKNSSRSYHSLQGKTHNSDLTSRYLVDCHDGFPHIVNQSQVLESPEES